MWLSCLVILGLFVRMMLLCGLCRVLWVVEVMMCVCGSVLGCLFVVIRFVMWVMLVKSRVFILLVILWKVVKLMMWL